MRVLAVDPGSEQSAWVLFDGNGQTVVEHGKAENDEVRHRMRRGWVRPYGDIDALVIEAVASYGMPVGAEVFSTVLWAGRFDEAAHGWFPQHLLFRKDVKLHLCQSPRANDATIRQALIDRYGGKEKAIGKKASQGPLYGIKADCWAALALACTWYDLNAQQAKAVNE